MTQVPSLRIWAISVSLLLVFIAVITVLCPDPVLFYLNASRLSASGEKINGTADHKRKVVYIGSSLTQYDLLFDDKMATLADAQGIHGYVFNRFYLPGPDLSYFYPLFEYLLEAKPEVIIFQSNLILYEKPRNTKREITFGSIPYNIYLYFKSLLGLKVNKRVYLHNRHSQETSQQKVKQLRQKRQTNATFLKIRNTMQTWNFRGVGNVPDEMDFFLRESGKSGSKIIFLELPIAPKLQDEAPASRIKERELMKWYESRYTNVKYVPYPHKISLNSFIDFSHMTPDARESYSIWFLDQLSSLTN